MKPFAIYIIIALLLLPLGVSVMMLFQPVVAPFQAMAVEPVPAISLYLAEDAPGEGLVAWVHPRTGEALYLEPEASLTGADIVSVGLLTEPGAAAPALEIVFTEDGARRLAALSRQHVGRPLAVVIDGELFLAPTIRGELGAKVLLSFGHEVSQDAVRAIGERLTGG